MSTINAISCSATDVQAAINSAADGDTVLIPAGSATWVNTVTCNKGITIRGAGIGLTTITDGMDRSLSDMPVLSWSALLGQALRLSDFTLLHQTGDRTYNGSIRFSGTTQALRVDHIDYRGTNMAFGFYGHLCGVVDHCFIDAPDPSFNGMRIEHTSWNGGLYGDGSWADDPWFGSNKAIFVEDCVFMGTRIGQNLGTAQDLAAGGRMVFRHNTINDMFFQCHGWADRIRPGRMAEVYNNTFMCSGADANPFHACIYWDAGSLLAHDNYARGYVNFIKTQNDRSIASAGFFGMANGSNLWDQNTDATGYACLDQPGRGKGDLLIGDNPAPAWPHQASEPLYEWANDWQLPFQWAGSILNSQSGSIRENRDYFVNTPKPGYVPYIYPHPLTAGTIPPPQAELTTVALAIDNKEVATGPIGTTLNHTFIAPKNPKPKPYPIKISFR